MMRRAAAAAPFVLLAGCFGLRRVPFEHSSLDFNGGRPHAALLEAASIETAAERVGAAAAARKLAVEERLCDPGECRLRLAAPAVVKEYSYRRKVTKTRQGKYNPKTGRYDYGDQYHLLDILIGHSGYHSSVHSTEEHVVGEVTDTIKMEFQSVLFARVRPENGRFAVELVGAPRRGGVLSCPTRAGDLGIRCQAQPFPVEKGETPASSTLKYWGADVSGREEAALAAALAQDLSPR